MASRSKLVLKFCPPALKFLNQQPELVVHHLVDEAVGLRDRMAERPDSPDIHIFLMPPAVGRLYIESCHWIVFYIDLERLMVANIGGEDEAPFLWRL